MKQSILVIFTLLSIASCRQSISLTENEKVKVTQEVRQILADYHQDIARSGLSAEFKYLDNSSEFFWVPPGYTTALSYDSVAAILKQNAPNYSTINNSFDTLSIIPLTELLASYTGRISSTMTDTAGKIFTFSLIETGVLIKREDGWKLLNGQTALIE